MWVRREGLRGLAARERREGRGPGESNNYRLPPPRRGPGGRAASTPLIPVILAI